MLEPVNKKKILVVDDERNIVRLLQVNLEKKGYEVVAAYDGIEASEQVKKEHPDMIILDWIMPRKNGMQFLKELMADPENNNIPVIMLTAKTQDADVFAGWASGVSCYLTKPFNPKDLTIMMARIFEYMNEHGSQWDGDEPIFDI